MIASLLLVSILAAPNVPDLNLPTGKEIALDGKIEAAEWADAFAVSRDHPDGGKLRLFMKRTGPWLALAVAGDGPYRGEIVRLYVSDADGAWITSLLLAVGQPHAPPALWRRGPPASLGDPRFGPGESPRAARARLDVRREDGWAAEYLLRLGSLGIGRGDLRELRALVRITLAEKGDLLVLPGEATDPTDPSKFARLVSADGWGREERWAPVPPDVSREFDDHELLFRLFLEHDKITLRDAPERIVIGNAVSPRNMNAIRSLRAALDAGQRHNPTLPSWDYFTGRLLHEANLYEDAAAAIAAIPAPIASFDACVNLRAEHYADTEQFDKVLELGEGDARWSNRDELVKLALLGRKAVVAEKEALKKDAAKSDKNPRVRFVTTKGAITCELFEDDAPHAVKNFMALVMEQNYYDGLQFHQVTGGRHAALGDPRTRRGSSAKADGPPWRIRKDNSKRPLLTGYISAAPAGPEVYHGSHLLSALAPGLTVKHADVFGRVIEGLDVLMSLEQDDRVEKVEILSKRNHAYDPLTARSSD